ncbi:MAG: cyclase family protein [Gammaproteobacteria bacterium]|nr:cyclase family protein [Gammaproteobacteria bacterium]
MKTIHYLKKSVLALAVLTFTIVAAPSLHAQQAEPMSRADFDALMEEISNWGRWGDDDELGTLNLITPQRRVAAAQQVTEGVSISLSLPVNKVQGGMNANPFEHDLSISTFGGHEVAGDRYSVQYHGFAHSHMDGLPHFAHYGQMYNGVSVDSLEADGSQKLGIGNAYEGVFSRGILIDMTWLRGVDYLEPGTAITVADLQEWERRTGIRVGSGDVLLIRTGRWERVRQVGEWNFVGNAAGSHASVARWLKERDVAVLGSDGVSDVMPSGVEGLINPLHALVLVGLGMPLLDNLDLDAVAEAARDRNRWEFLFVGAPLRVEGGTGSPMNPLAIF